jgi:hypothetical protein
VRRRRLRESAKRRARRRPRNVWRKVPHHLREDQPRRELLHLSMMMIHQIAKSNATSPATAAIPDVSNYIATASLQEGGARAATAWTATTTSCMPKREMKRSERRWKRTRKHLEPRSRTRPTRPAATARKVSASRSTASASKPVFIVGRSASAPTARTTRGPCSSKRGGRSSKGRRGGGPRRGRGRPRPSKGRRRRKVRALMVFRRRTRRRRRRRSSIY